ncbi:unnamed protein product [Ilex paraguariensis]|uniref:RNase H type-1 domain-containing protein n=1 Tax=Ilex paraguariensis TaxID=185542 RepID=A0ABC8TY01_9AQUA
MGLSRKINGVLSEENLEAMVAVCTQMAKEINIPLLELEGDSKTIINLGNMEYSEIRHFVDQILDYSTRLLSLTTSWAHRQENLAAHCLGRYVINCSAFLYLEE